MKEEMKSTQVIEIPEGTFEGNCSDCVYADWNTNAKCFDLTEHEYLE